MKIYWVFFLVFVRAGFCQAQGLKGQKHLTMSIFSVDTPQNSPFSEHCRVGVGLSKTLVHQKNRTWHLVYQRRHYLTQNISIPVESCWIGYTSRYCFTPARTTFYIEGGGVGGYQWINRGKKTLNAPPMGIVSKDMPLWGLSAESGILLGQRIALSVNGLWIPPSYVQKFHISIGITWHIPL